MSQSLIFSERRSFLVALIFGVFAICGTTVLAVLPRTGEHVAVIVWPDDRRGDRIMNIVAGADARLVSRGGFGWVAIASEQSPRPGRPLAERLYAAGALLVMNADIVTACLGIADKSRGT